MTSAITLEDVVRAQSARDPGLAELVIALAEANDPQPSAPIRDGALTTDRWAREIRSRRFRRLSAEEQTQRRIEGMRALEAEDAEVPLPDRWKLHRPLLELWRADGAWARRQLLAVIARVPLKFGPWRAIKQIFKEAEAGHDYEMFGAIAARLDVEFTRSWGRRDVSRRTLGYLVRRAWRHLRHIAESMPACYADAAVEVLRFYPDDTRWNSTWIGNHLLYHGTGKYTRRRWRLGRRPTTLLKYRAYPDLWKRTPRPLFTLLEQAKSDQARRFAVDALKSDFRAALREVEPSWVLRLIAVSSVAIHRFVVWLLDNVPRFEQAGLRDLGLHDAALSLLESPAAEGRAWAAGYARTHARDLSFEALLRFVDNDNDAVRAMARDLISALDARKDVGLDGWGRLLAIPHAFDFAAENLRKHFTARDLTRDWFRARLLSGERAVVRFATELMPKVHTLSKVASGWFIELLDGDGLNRDAARFALSALGKRKPDTIDAETWRRLLVHPQASHQVRSWIEEGRLSAEGLGAEWLKAVADAPTWAADAAMQALTASGPQWARELEFDHGLAAFALGLLADVRLFSPDALGFDWLLGMVERTDAQAHDFAVEYMTKAFVPADFAPKDADEAAPAADAGEINIDLELQTFLFTGKLATMTRSEAKKKVTAAHGKNASGVNGKLDYLVIGDEGSSLYGQGRKGSKQVKAEKLIDKGAGIRIISETAFLQMLAGKQRKVDDDSTEKGCERLWEMLTGPDAPDAPLSRFARHYIRRHHVDICPVETDRYVDPGAEIPPTFLDFERVSGLLADSRAELRAQGLEFARWSLAEWAPPMRDIVTLCELPYPEVRGFFAEALTVELNPDTKRFRLDPAMLTPEAVYRFCESLDEATRALGMTLIGRHPRLAVPEELFRLTESPDRRVRAFVVGQLWRLYRDRGTTAHWKPSAPPETSIGRRKKKAVDRGEGAPARPESPPASADDLRGFLRRTLFGLPPARPPKARAGGGQRLKPLPGHVAKRALIEVVRDLAIEDAVFARHVSPVLTVFTDSRGKSERAACLVALARIRAAHPDLTEEAA